MAFEHGLEVKARRIATNNRALARGRLGHAVGNGDALTFAKANDEYLRWKRFPPPRADNRQSNQRYRCGLHDA